LLFLIHGNDGINNCGNKSLQRWSDYNSNIINYEYDYYPGVLKCMRMIMNMIIQKTNVIDYDYFSM